jgi:hypothetical protein
MSSAYIDWKIRHLLYERRVSASFAMKRYCECLIYIDKRENKFKTNMSCSMWKVQVRLTRPLLFVNYAAFWWLPTAPSSFLTRIWKEVASVSIPFSFFVLRSCHSILIRPFYAFLGPAV